MQKRSKKEKEGGKLSRKAALIREQQRGGRIGEKGIFCSVAFDGRGPRKSAIIRGIRAFPTRIS